MKHGGWSKPSINHEISLSCCFFLVAKETMNMKTLWSPSRELLIPCFVSRFLMMVPVSDIVDDKCYSKLSYGDTWGN